MRKTAFLRQSAAKAALVALMLGLGTSTQAVLATASAAETTSTTTTLKTTTRATEPPPTRDVTGRDLGLPAHERHTALPIEERAPLPASKDELRRDYDTPGALKITQKRPSDTGQKAKTAAQLASAVAETCDVSDFTGNTGDALVAAIKASATSCVNTLFTLTGTDAAGAFREAQMVTVANAYRTNALSYTGDNSAGTAQLVLYLRAGYYVQWYHQQDVGPYGDVLRDAIRPALDAFFASSHSRDVSDINGEILSESVTLIDSAGQNARYLDVVKRLLNDYDSSYDNFWWMRNAVNAVFTVLFRGHSIAEFVSNVQSDTSVLDTLQSFASRHLDLLGTGSAFLTRNAGRELARFLQHTTLRDTVRPKVKSLLDQTSITGTTAPLWVGLAEMADFYDRANCSSYGVCDLANRLKAAALPVSHTCSPSLRVLAQEINAEQLSASCASLRNQDAYFHNLVASGGRPVADDNNTTLEVVVFDSPADYQTYAGAIYGIDTNNGGMYLEGDPSAAGNQPRFIAYEATWVRPAFEIWNLNHEYTHYLDGRYDMYGDFGAGSTTPTVWWSEGLAEYVSWSYQNRPNTTAYTEAGKHTYKLSQLFDTVYGQGETRIYTWGYLAVRYMFERQRAEVGTLLGNYRTGNWNAARTYLASLDHDADWEAWLTACAAGECASAPVLPDCPGQDIRAMGKNCKRANASHTVQNYAYFYIWLPQGTTQLKITASGGTGNADLYFNKNNWATTNSYTAKSTNSGNSETLTVTDLNPNGWNHLSLYGVTDFSGVTVTTEY
ncbi:M9 family metallopeptidase [Nonomuraea sp. NPDC049152]|uniref:M9 family metallopeptidase n=1 Tax=Nonomuraea sp. NPDC049152 TaxID=3154350 RepID=UPI0033C143C0